MNARKVTCLILTVIIALIFGYIIGRTQTIHQAELMGINDYEYYISFGDEIHAYTKEVNPND